jgi:long-subunit acyl-CoA synthetase (AMP-forming)
MGGLTIYTSGSTQEPKQIHHTWENIEFHLQENLKITGLTKDDIVLDFIPGNTIASHVASTHLAKKAGATLHTMAWDPYRFLKMFEEVRPTYIVMIPRHFEILENTHGWKELDMSCVRYLMIGSQPVSQELIDLLRSKGVQTVGHWYGMTEMPPPVFNAENSEFFDLKNPCKGFKVEFGTDGELIVNGLRTRDIFDINTGKFIRRKGLTATGKTWKTI